MTENTLGLPGAPGYAGYVGPAGPVGQTGGHGANGAVGYSGPRGSPGKSIDCLRCLASKCKINNCYSKNVNNPPNVEQCNNWGCYILPDSITLDGICLRHNNPAGCPTVEEPPSKTCISWNNTTKIPGCTIPQSFLDDLTSNPSNYDDSESEYSINGVFEPLSTTHSSLAVDDGILLVCASQYCVKTSANSCKKVDEAITCTVNGWEVIDSQASTPIVTEFKCAPIPRESS